MRFSVFSDKIKWTMKTISCLIALFGCFPHRLFDGSFAIQFSFQFHDNVIALFFVDFRDPSALHDFLDRRKQIIFVFRYFQYFLTPLQATTSSGNANAVSVGFYLSETPAREVRGNRRIVFRPAQCTISLFSRHYHGMPL